MTKTSRPVYRLATNLVLALTIALLKIDTAQGKTKNQVATGPGAVIKDQHHVAGAGCGATKSQAKVKCWVYKQKDFTAGDFTVYISDKYARCDAMRNHGVIVAKAPDWNVLLYNKEGESFKVTRKIWVRDGLGSSTGDLRIYFGGLKASDLLPTTYEGYPAVRVERDLNVDHDLLLSGSEPAGDHKRRDPRINHVTMLAGTRALGAGPLDFYSGLLKVPPIGLPLYSLERCERGGFKRWSIRTISISQQELPVSFFMPPANLKQAATIGKVIYGSATEDFLLQMSGADQK